MKYLIIGIIAFAAAVGFISCKQEIVYEPPVFPKQQQVDCRHITGQSTICIPLKQRRRHDCLTNGAVIKTVSPVKKQRRIISDFYYSVKMNIFASS